MFNEQSIRWVIAIKSEAKLIIENFQLEPFLNESHFKIYKNHLKNHWLIISGIGNKNVKNAISYLNKIVECNKSTIWINLGTAGFINSYGKLFYIDKIYENSLSRKLYPSTVITSDLPRQNLLTLEKPSENYFENMLIDMEGFTFYEETSKIASKELIVVLKIVSDDFKNPLKNFSSSQVELLVKNNLKSIEKLVGKLSELSQKLFKEIEIPNSYFTICDKWHFTFSQKNQLLSLIKRWEALFPNESLINDISNFKNSKLIIKFLNSKFKNYEIHW